MAPRYALREATVDDLDTLVRHRRRMFEDMGEARAADLDATDRAYRRWARTRLRSGRLFGFVVETRGEAVGSGCVWRQPMQPRPGIPFDHRPYLMSMYTDPAHRGHGVATRIVKAAMARVKKEGYPLFALHASAAGQPVYERLGWRAGREMVLRFE